jgi:putative resolvase
MIKLSKWAKQQGISYSTAWRHWKRGLIKGAIQLDTGTIMVEEAISDAENKLRRIKEIINE